MRRTRMPAWLGRMALERHMDAVRTYTTLGWPVCTATYAVNDGCSCGRPSCTAPGAHPASAPTTRASEIASVLRREPEANLMVATGHVTDAVEVPVPRGRAVLAGAPGIGPIAAAAETYVFFVASDEPLLTPGARWYGKGGYVLVPPSTLPSGHTMAWIRDPESPLPSMAALATALFQS